MNALVALKDDINDFEQFISSRVEIIVEDMIRAYLDDTSPNNYKKIDDIRLYEKEHPQSMDVADSLSFEAIEDDRPKVKISKGLTKETLEQDNQIEDPEHEAISEDNEEATFDELFGSEAVPEDSEEALSDVPVFQIPELPLVSTPRPYAKKMPKVKARVSECTNAHDSGDF